MARNPRIRVNLVIISSLRRQQGPIWGVNLEGFVAKEVYRLVSVLFNVAKTVRLIPARGETIERDLPTYRQSKPPGIPNDRGRRRGCYQWSR